MVSELQWRTLERSIWNDGTVKHQVDENNEKLWLVFLYQFIDLFDLFSLIFFSFFLFDSFMWYTNYNHKGQLIFFLSLFIIKKIES